MKAPTVAAVVADFYPDIAEGLVESCRAELEKHGETLAPVIKVPGALEIPSALRHVSSLGHALLNDCNLKAFVALGCVIRGETYHFEVVAQTCAQGILQLQLQHGLAIGNGVLTVENFSQAKERIDKGAAAARAALRLAALKAGEK